MGGETADFFMTEWEIFVCLFVGLFGLKKNRIFFSRFLVRKGPTAGEASD